MCIVGLVVWCCPVVLRVAQRRLWRRLRCARRCVVLGADCGLVLYFFSSRFYLCSCCFSFTRMNLDDRCPSSRPVCISPSFFLRQKLALA